MYRLLDNQTMLEKHYKAQIFQQARAGRTTNQHLALKMGETSRSWYAAEILFSDMYLGSEAVLTFLAVAWLRIFVFGDSFGAIGGGGKI